MIGLWLLACSGDPVDSGEPCTTDLAQFEAAALPVFASDCRGCHIDGGVAGHTRLLVPSPDDVEAAYTTLAGLFADPALGTLLLEKPTAQQGHGGGPRFDVLSDEYAALQEFAARAQAPGACAHPGDPPPSCEPGVWSPGPTPLRRLTDRQWLNAVEDLLGVRLPDGVFPATARGEGYHTWAANNTVSAAGAESILLATEQVAAQVDPDALMDCQSGESAWDCALRTALALADRAFRRPLLAAETETLNDLVGAGDDAEEGLLLAIQVMLQAPPFLYLDTTGAQDPTGAGPQRLSDHAIAAQLALFLVDSLPDQALRAAADAGELHTREQVAEHAARLVASPQALRAVAGFHRDWVADHRLDGASRDATLYPDFTDATLQSMRTELELMATEILWSDGHLATLLTSQDTWIDSQLAPLYGLDDPGPGWHRVTLDSDRPGVLTRTAFLTGHAYSATSAPVRRGAWILERLLCESLSPPQDVDMELPEESSDATTIRERLEQHWTDPACAACHTRIDPLGFAFEHFGPVGEWRDTWEDDTPVDASGSLLNPAGSFDGAAEMLALVGTTDRAAACYARQWFEYALGRPSDALDTCTLDTLATRFQDSDQHVPSLLVDIASSDAFLMRWPLEAE